MWRDIGSRVPQRKVSLGPNRYSEQSRLLYNRLNYVRLRRTRKCRTSDKRKRQETLRLWWRTRSKRFPLCEVLCLCSSGWTRGGLVGLGLVLGSDLSRWFDWVRSSWCDDWCHSTLIYERQISVMSKTTTSPSTITYMAHRPCDIIRLYSFLMLKLF